MITDVKTYKVFFLSMFISAVCFSLSTIYDTFLFGKILVGIGIVFFTISVLVFWKPATFSPYLVKILEKIYEMSGKKNVAVKDGILYQRNQDEEFYRR